MGWFGKSREENFWTWFGSNDERLFAFEQNPESALSDLLGQLKRVHPDLVFELGPVEEGRREIVISAGGLRNAFPAVEKLVTKAPPMERWRPIAFRPPRSLAGEIAIGNVRLRPETLAFVAAPDGGLIGVTLLIPGFRPTPGGEYERLGFLALDRAIGERAVATRLGYIDFADSSAPQQRSAKPLAELPATVEEWFSH